MRSGPVPVDFFEYVQISLESANPMSNTTIAVSGMTCDHCKAAVERALKKVAGVQSVEVDRIAGSAKVDWDDTVTKREQLVQCITDSGYPAN